jgi:hypothetical protein
MMLKEAIKDNNNLYKVSKQCVEYINILSDRKERSIGMDETKEKEKEEAIMPDYRVHTEAESDKQKAGRHKDRLNE